MKNLQSPAVGRGDLRRLNYNNCFSPSISCPANSYPAQRSAIFMSCIFSAPLTHTTGRAHDTLSVPHRMGRGFLLPIPPLSCRDQRAPLSSELVPHFLDRSYAPAGCKLFFVSDCIFSLLILNSFISYHIISRHDSLQQVPTSCVHIK